MYKRQNQLASAVIRLTALRASMTVILALLSGIFNITLSQTTIGTSEAKLEFYEYYRHVVEQEWVKLFTVKNYDMEAGQWGKGGVSGRVYFIDYQGSGGSYADFAFPQKLNADQKPTININGNSGISYRWYILRNGVGTSLESYDVYLRTPPAHLGLSFLIRAADYTPYFLKADPPSQNFSWSSSLNPESFIFNKSNGNIGMGTLNPQEKLSVNGKIRAKEVKVEVSDWPDFVFSSGYELPTLAETERFIRFNGHLPGIPKAVVIEKEGLSLGEMNKLLLKKIEELTLYLIEKDGKISALESDKESQHERIEKIEQILGIRQETNKK